MPPRWKERIKKMARANARARDTETRRMTLDRATRVIEGLLSNPLTEPRPRSEHPVSCSRRLRRPNV